MCEMLLAVRPVPHEFLEGRFGVKQIVKIRLSDRLSNFGTIDSVGS
jgi:hypothetical protein